MAFFRGLSAALIIGAAVYMVVLRYRFPSSPSSLPPGSDHHRHAGLRDIPSFGLGTWLSDRDKVAHAVDFALESGYEHIDAALIYRNEDQTGKGIAAAGVPRDRIWVTSKLWNTDHRRAEAEAAVAKSINDLGVDRLDLYLMHWPVAFVPGGKDNELDVDTSIVDTWRVMEDLVRANRTRLIGVSNFARRDLERILAACEVCPYAHEFETHPYLQQQDFVDWHRDVGVRVIAYSPLANTNPTYHHREVAGDDGAGAGAGAGAPSLPPILEDPFWLDLAARKNATVAQAVLAWGLQRGTVVIPKSVRERHLTENLGALDIEFTADEMAAVARQDRRTRMNDPGRAWGVRLFADLDDPTRLDGDADADAAGEDQEGGEL
ncbi:aldo/keto reductase [Xylariaceae sp. FL0804]|nr:aldo/keto reductase [Xylariaceae sp. FL0804]